MLRTDEVSGASVLRRCRPCAARECGCSARRYVWSQLRATRGLQVGAGFLCGGGVTADAHRWATSATISCRASSMAVRVTAGVEWFAWVPSKPCARCSPCGDLTGGYPRPILAGPGFGRAYL